MDISEILAKAKKPLSVSEIAAKTGMENASVKQALDALYEEGAVVPAKGGKYAHPRIMGLKLCRARTSRGGPAFARPVDGGSDYLMDMADEQAFDGDLVFVRETRSGTMARADLVYIVKRSRTVVTGVLVIRHPEVRYSHRKAKRGRPRFVPEDICMAALNDRRLPSDAYVSGDLKGAQAGDLCLFDVLHWPDRHHSLSVQVNRVIGAEKDAASHLAALCAVNDIRRDFPSEVLSQAEGLGDDPREADLVGRLDLRDDVIFTIDGADAKDFDDAVSLRCEDGIWHLGVHISDVSHYVTEGTALDDEARSRGTSVYLPGLTLPMLPERLSNGLCSLMPDRDRLTFSAIMDLNEAGDVIRYTLKPSVIHSRARLTYEEVNRLFAGEKCDVPEALHGVLRDMNELAHLLYQKRVHAGSLELDLLEADFTLGSDGWPTDMGIRERGDAHKLIEEFMLCANRTVALHAVRTRLPFPYRVHEKPDSDKLAALEPLLLALGKPMQLGRIPNQSRLQAVLDAFNGKPQRVIIADSLLRSMSKACYSEKNLGHYGLAFTDYCHFTSPIRRYPDLLAHRMLHLQISAPPSEEASESLTHLMQSLTAEASACEERAARCERDADRLMCTACLNNSRGKLYYAYAVRFLRKGIVVRLDNGCEGLIPNKYTDDEYSPDEAFSALYGRFTGHIIHLGDLLRVRCVRADTDSCEIEFSMSSGRGKR